MSLDSLTAKQTTLQNEANAVITKCVTGIVLDDPFYGYLLLRLQRGPSFSVESMATDGVRLVYNPAFVTSIPIQKIKGVIKHEIMHVALLHNLRIGSREHLKWNIACDRVINCMLTANGVDLPEGVDFEPTDKDYSAEHIYNLLPESPEETGTEKGWNFGEVLEHPELTEGDLPRIEEEQKLEIINAYNAAKMQGKIPAGLERVIEKIRHSKMPWKTILAKFFKSLTKEDEDWSKPHRRWLAHNVYLPSRNTESLDTVVIANDTSGSVTKAELEMFYGCINAILRFAKPNKIIVICCDSKIPEGGVQVYRVSDLPLTPEKLIIKGGGGTDFSPPFEWVSENKIKPDIFLYLTDMECRFPEKAPKYPVIWCATSQRKAPWGKTLEIV